MFWRKKPLHSEEYDELSKKLSNLSIKIESLDLEVQLYKKKLKAKAGIVEEKETETKKDPFNGVLLGE